MKTFCASFVGKRLNYLPLALAAWGSLLPAVNPAFAQTWTQTSAPSNSWHAIAMSADGTWLVAVASAGAILFSTNSGDTWMPATAPAQNWFSVVSSADGTRLVAENIPGIGAKVQVTDPGAAGLPKRFYRAATLP